MRIVVFANGGLLPLRSLEILQCTHEVVAVVRPAPPRTLRAAGGRLARRIGVRARDPLATWLAGSAAPVLHHAAGGDATLAEQLRALRPDLMCIVTYPVLLGAALLGLPRLGVVNLHPSLLPRHRGAEPYVWMYFHDDRECGVTIHRAVRKADAGPILAQSAVDIPRGCSINDLHATLARRGAALLAGVVDGLGRGTLVGREQDDALATPAPRVPRGTALVPFGEWNAERVWHFLTGLHPHFREPLRDADGEPVVYAGVAGYRQETPGGRPGQVEAAPHGWKLWCRDGVVYLLDRAAC